MVVKWRYKCKYVGKLINVNVNTFLHVCNMCMIMWTVVWQEPVGIFTWQWEFSGCSQCAVWICLRDKTRFNVRLLSGRVLSLGSQVGSSVHLEDISFICWTYWQWWCFTLHTRLCSLSVFATLELHILFLCCDTKQVDEVSCRGGWSFLIYVCVIWHDVTVIGVCD